MVGTVSVRTPAAVLGSFTIRRPLMKIVFLLIVTVPLSWSMSPHSRASNSPLLRPFTRNCFKITSQLLSGIEKFRGQRLQERRIFGLFRLCHAMQMQSPHGFRGCFAAKWTPFADYCLDRTVF